MPTFDELQLQTYLWIAGKSLSLLPSLTVNELLRILRQVESLLYDVKQSPTRSMMDSLRPTMDTLICEEFQGFSDEELKVSVASCINELIRITAPVPPYDDDDVMKDVFQSIVETFEKLDDMSSLLFYRRVVILETFANVRSCTLMLDLPCDDLILQMFHHFINTIRSYNSHMVFSFMETIMTTVLEESDEISPDLISCLLDTVNLDNKDILPVAHELGVKVIKNCADKLKPYLNEFFQSKYASLRKSEANIRNIYENGTVASETSMFPTNYLNGFYLNDLS